MSLGRLVIRERTRWTSHKRLCVPISSRAGSAETARHGAARKLLVHRIVVPRPDVHPLVIRPVEQWILNRGVFRWRSRSAPSCRAKQGAALREVLSRGSRRIEEGLSFRMQLAPALERGLAACLSHSGARDCAQLPGHDISPMVISRPMTFTSRLIRSLSCCMSILLGSGLTIEPYVIKSGVGASVWTAH